MPESLPALCTSAADDADRWTQINSLLKEREPALELMEIASLPWSCVLCSAVDSAADTAFRQAGVQRDFVEVAPARLRGLARARSTKTLNVVRLYGSLSGLPGCEIPRNSRALERARKLGTASVAEALPDLLGLRGVLVIAGWSPRDWLDAATLEVLSYGLETVPEGRIFIFGTTPRTLPTDFAARAQVDTRTLGDHIRDWNTNSEVKSQLQEARTRVFGTSERVMTLRVDGRARPVRFTASDWRHISSVASALDDEAIDRLREERVRDKSAIARFLRQSRAGVPDWSGPAMGMIFGRTATGQLVDGVRAFLDRGKSSVHETDRAVAARRVPRLLSGPPAVGKSLGLLDAAWQLRVEHEVCVLFLLRRAGFIDHTAIERVVRLIQERGASWVVLVADDLEVEEYVQLNEHLNSSGRNALLLGVENRLGQVTDEDLVTRIPVDSAVDASEASGFQDWLKRLGFQTALPAHAGSHILELLSSAFPEVRIGALPPLLQEIERFRTASHADVGDTDTFRNEGLAAQLRARFPELASSQRGREQTRFDLDHDVRQILELTLFASQLDFAVPVEVLSAALGGRLLANYGRFARLFEKSALVQEVDLDAEGGVGLSTEHALVAELLLRWMRPSKAHQLALLSQFARAIEWDAEALPGTRPTQDFVIALIEAVRPRGRKAERYASRESLLALDELFEMLRTTVGVVHPKLLAWHAIVLGDLAQKSGTPGSDEQRSHCERALELLHVAQEVLSTRHPSPSRSHEMARVLTLAADIRGTLMTSVLRTSNAADTAARYESVRPLLAEIESDVARARVAAPSYDPLDINFWAHRNALQSLPNLDEEDCTRLLATIQNTLDLAREEPLEGKHRSDYERRLVEFHGLRKQHAVAEQLATAMRMRGDFAGECVRTRAILDAAPPAQRRQTARAELERLTGYRPAVLADLRAVRLLHGLWVDVFVGDSFGKGTPVFVAAERDQWELLRQIVEARLSFEADADLSYALFFSGWALYQLGEGYDAQRLFERLDRQSLGRRWRVGQLAVLTDSTGHARPFDVVVSQAEGLRVKARIPDLSWEGRLGPEVVSAVAPSGVSIGQHLRLSVALNYRGLLLIP